MYMYITTLNGYIVSAYTYICTVSGYIGPPSGVGSMMCVVVIMGAAGPPPPFNPVPAFYRMGTSVIIAYNAVAPVGVLFVGGVVPPFPFSGTVDVGGIVPPPASIITTKHGMDISCHATQ